MPLIPTAATRRAVLCSTALAPVLLAALPALAQDDTTLALDEIVVTASGFEQTVDQAPASITVIPGEQLQTRNVTNLSDALRGVQGVSTVGSSGSKDISIRGLPGDYTLILVDGKRQGTRESRTNGSSGYEQSFIPPMAAIERIEVVRGPMSSLYGSDAMGGVVNIITKPVATEWSGSVTVSSTIPEDNDDGTQSQAQFYTAGPLSARAGLQVWGRILHHSESDRIEGTPEERERDINARLTYMLTDNQDIQFEVGSTRVEHDNTIGKSVDPANSRAANSEEVNYRDHVSLTHKGRFSWGDTEMFVNHERGERNSWSDGERSTREPEITNTTVEARATIPWALGGAHRTVTGAQYIRNELEDQNPGLDTMTRNFDMDQYAIYAEDEWQILPDFALTTGARVTKHSEYGSHISPRIYGVWNATPDLIMKGGISTGYKTPSLRSIVPDYYYTTERGAGLIVSNPDLDPEESVSYELGTSYMLGQTKLGATVFRTEFDNKISNYKTDQTVDVGNGPFNLWLWDNIDEAVIKGVELTASTDLTPDLRLRASYTYTHSEQKSGDYAGLPLNRTPQHAASLNLDWTTPIDGLDAWTAVNYHGTEINSGLRIGGNGSVYETDASGNVLARKYGAYTTMDLGANYALNDSVTLSGAIYNIFDKETGAADYNSVNEGRRLWVSVTSTF